MGAVQDVDMYILKCISQYGDNQVAIPAEAPSLAILCRPFESCW